MRPVTLSAFMILLVLSAGCSPTMVSFFDQDSRAQISRMSGNRLAGGLTSVELNGQRFDKGEGLAYSLIVVYSGPTFIGIGEGKTLVLVIDGRRLEVAGTGSGRNRTTLSVGLIEEKAYYHDIDPDLIRTLAYAKEVEVEIIGTRKTLNRHFKEKNFTNFREFYELHVKRGAGS